MKFFCRASAPGAQNHFRLRRGFTLIEIMIAIALLTMLVAAIYATLMVIVRSAQVGQSTAARAQRERIAIRTIEDSLMCIQSFQASMTYYTFVVQNGDQAGLSFTARLPEGFPRNGRFVNPDQGRDFNLRRLTFALEPGKDSQNNLVLRQNPILMDLDKDEQATPLVLAGNVKKFTVECWDPVKLDWTDEWDATNSIPKMVRINLELGGKSDSANAPPVLSVSRIVAIPSITLPSVAQGGRPLSGGGLQPGMKQPVQPK